MLEQTLAYDKVNKLFGTIAEVSFIKGTITLSDALDELHECQIDDIVELKKVGELGEDVVFNHDVLVGHGTNKDKKWEVELLGNNKAVMHLLDRKLNRVETGNEFDLDLFSHFNASVSLLGSIYELEAESLVDFNIRIVRQSMNGDIKYFYACNNKDNEEIDLIKVIYMGSQLLEEEDYQRVTVSHEDYVNRLDKGLLKEVSANELQNYVMGMTYKPTKKDIEDMVVLKPVSDSYEEVDEEDDCMCSGCVESREESDEDICEKCGEPEEDCDCELWEN